MKKNESAKMANIRMLEFVAIKLGNLREKVVFLGGCTTSLFMTDPLSPDVRTTIDVDCIVDVISRSKYYEIEEQLKELGFKQSLQEEAPICRWNYDDIKLDVMPTDEAILGFTNRWYKDAIKFATTYMLSDTLTINVVTAPYFLATKLEAFKTRGKKDCYDSHDFEDIIAVMDARDEIVSEIHECDQTLRDYIVDSFVDLLNNDTYREAIPGHFRQYHTLANDRIEMLETKIRAIING